MRALARVAALGAAAALLLWLALALLRAPYPFELEWQEGGLLAQVERVLAGQPLYVRPTPDYAPFPYPPLYTWCAAGVAWVVGPSFAALRSLSIAASLVLYLCLAALASRPHGRRAGLLAAGLLAASYAHCGSWLDLARVDATALAALLGGVLLLARGSGLASALAGGLCLAAACLAKQSAALPALVYLAARAPREPRSTLVALGAAASALLACALVLEARSAGWFRWTVIDVLAGHEWSAENALAFWLDLARSWWPALLLVAWNVLRPASGRARAAPEELLLGLALLLASWLEATHTGSYDNCRLPAAIALALAASRAVEQLGRSGERAAALAPALFLAQLACLAYDPRAELPSAADRAAGEALVAKLRESPGPVFLPYHDYLARRAGKGPSAHAMAIIDLLRSGERAVAAAFTTELEQSLNERRYAWIVLDDPIWERNLPALIPNYRRVEQLFPAEDRTTFVPVTGAPWRPLLLYERRP